MTRHGLTYQGTPCKRGGHTERYWSNGHCAPCAREAGSEYWQHNREHIERLRRARRRQRKEET